MLKKTLFLASLSSVFIHLFFSWQYPLIADELNVWNIFNINLNFLEFWQYFIKYDTHQPIFYLFWYPLYSTSLTQVTLRLPSIFLFMGSIYFWQKLMPWRVEGNRVPWLLFLFSPFVVMYSTFFLPYSLLIFSSLINYYFFEKAEKKLSIRSASYFFCSCILLIYTHYYGALQATLTGMALIFLQKDKKIRRILAFIVLLILGMLLITSDFINDFTAIHSYRKSISLKDIFGNVNILFGGRYITALILILLITKKKFSIFKTREFFFVAMVILIALMKSIMFSPSLEARYLLILLYPLYSLTKDLEVRYISPILILLCLISLYHLEQSYGPSFAIDFRKVKKSTIKTGLLITPCPKFYFPEENYSCKTYFQNQEQLQEDIDQMIVHKDHIKFYFNKEPMAICKPLIDGLLNCNFLVK